MERFASIFIPVIYTALGGVLVKIGEFLIAAGSP